MAVYKSQRQNLFGAQSCQQLVIDALKNVPKKCQQHHKTVQPIQQIHFILPSSNSHLNLFLVVKIITQTKNFKRWKMHMFHIPHVTLMRKRNQKKWLSSLKARTSGSSKDSPIPSPRDQALLHLSNKVAEVLPKKCVPKSRRFFLVEKVRNVKKKLVPSGKLR